MSQSQTETLSEKDYGIVASELLRRLPTMVAGISNAGKVVLWNDECAEITGYSAEEMYADSEALNRICPSPEARRELMEQCTAGTAVRREWPLIDKGGNERVISWSFSPDISKNTNCFIVGLGLETTPFRRAADFLRESEERYRNLIHNAGVGVWHVDSEGKTVFANPVMQQLLEVDSQEALAGMTYHHFFGPENLRIVEEERKKRLRLEASTYEVTMQGVRGTVRRVRIHGSPVANHEGNYKGMIATFVDLTQHYEMLAQRDRLAHESRQLLERMQLVLERLPIGCICLDQDFKVTYCNPTAEAIFGFSAEELIGRHPFETVIPPVAHRFGSELFDRLRKGDMLCYAIEQNVKKDGTLIFCEWSNTPLHDQNGEFAGAISMCQDVTDRIRAERELRRQTDDLTDWKNRHEALIRAAGHVLYEFDTSTLTQTFGGTFDQTMGFSSSDPATQALNWWVERVHPDDRAKFEQFTERAIATEAPFYLEYRVQRSDGRYIYVEDRGYSLREATGKGKRIIGFVLDITERKRAEQEIRMLNEGLERKVRERTAQLEEVNAELDSFTYRVAHDLRAPLRGLQGLADALLTDFGSQLPEIGRRYAHQIVGTAARMDTLIRDLLAYSHLTRANLKLRAVDLNKVVLDSMRQLEAEIQSRQAQITIEEPLPVVYGDRSAIGQVITNLLSNAIKFIPAGR